MRSRPARKMVGALAPLCFAALFFGGCGTVKSPAEPAPTGPEVAPLTFTEIQTQIFTPVCAKAGCHAAGSSPSGLVLEAGQSYGNLVGHRAAESPLDRVSPGHPEVSYILLKLRGDPSITGERMPLGGPYLPSAEIDGIAAWIRAGAPRN
jgi:hypothetical protein